MEWLVRILVASFFIAGVAGVGHSTARADEKSREACMDQWLFNGVWRVEITKVEPFMNGPQQAGWQVTEVWRNGTAGGLSPSQSQLLDERLELSNGAVMAKDSTSGTMSLGGLGFNTFAPAGQFTYKQIFLPPGTFDPTNEPKGLEILFNGSLLAQMKSTPQFTTSHYDFHYNLGCVATGAAATAEGGSTQIAGTSGCLNQWMSNRVWKMRVISLTPRLIGGPGSGQIGWLANQEWVNITGRPVYPGGLPGGPAVQTNVTDEYLVVNSGNASSSANAVGGFALGGRNVAFPPNGSYTFGQYFSWSPFDPNDKPIRLLVTFNSALQNSLAGLPHYRIPPDFRIDLTCTK